MLMTSMPQQKWFLQMRFILKVNHKFPSTASSLGVWKIQFEKEMTWIDAPFYKLDGEEAKVERMQLTTNLQYGMFDNISARAVRIPFEQ